MKFSLFVHMERLTPEQSHNELYEEFIELCEIADQGGMTAIWTGEHHGMDFTIAPNPFINLADLASRANDGAPRHRHRHRSVLASDQARRRGGDDRHHHRRPARHRHRPRRLHLRVPAPHARPRRLERPASACASSSRPSRGCGPATTPMTGEFWSVPEDHLGAEAAAAAAPADLGRSARSEQPRLRRRQRLQRAGHAALAGRRGGRRA